MLQSRPVPIRLEKFRSWIIGIAAGGVLLLLASVLAVVLLVDPNRFRGQIETLVHETTGRPFEIRGDLDIAWFPWLAVQMGAAQLGNKDGVTGPPLVQWQSAFVGVRLIPLLRGEMVVDRIRLHGMKAFLRRDAQGKGNWEDLMSPDETPAKKKRKAPELAGLELREGLLEFLDEKSGLHVRISDWSLDIGEWKAGEFFPVSTQGVFADLATVEPKPGLALELESEVRLPDPLEGVELQKTALKGRVHGGGFPQEGFAIEAELPKLTTVFSPLAIAAPQATFQIADAKGVTALDVQSDSAKRVRASGPLSVNIPSVREFLTDLGIDAPSPKDKKALGALTLSAPWAYTDGVIAVKPIALKLDDTTFDGDLVRTAGAEPVITFQLHGDRIDLAKYVLLEDTNDEPFELPVAALREIKAQGAIRFDEATFATTLVKKMVLRFVLEDGQFQKAAATP